MPKIIANLENRLIQEAQRQIHESGYSAMTIRSVASHCGVGVGTVYNYFASKEELLARFLLMDWTECVNAIRAVSDPADHAAPVLRCIHEQLLNFSGKHQAIFRDHAAVAAFSGSFARYHAMLRKQLADPLARFCRDAFTAEFISEALLTWTMAGKSFEEIYGIVEKLL